MAELAARKADQAAFSGDELCRMDFKAYSVGSGAGGEAASGAGWTLGVSSVGLPLATWATRDGIDGLLAAVVDHGRRARVTVMVLMAAYAPTAAVTAAANGNGNTVGGGSAAGDRVREIAVIPVPHGGGGAAADAAAAAAAAAAVRAALAAPAAGLDLSPLPLPVAAAEVAPALWARRQGNVGASRKRLVPPLLGRLGASGGGT